MPHREKNKGSIKDGNSGISEMRNHLRESLAPHGSSRSFDDLNSLKSPRPHRGMPLNTSTRSIDRKSPIRGIRQHASSRSVDGHSIAPVTANPNPSNAEPDSSINPRPSSFLGGDMYGSGYGSGYGMGYGMGYGGGMGYGMGGYGMGGYGMGGSAGSLGNYVMWLQSLNYTLMSLGSLVQTFGLNAQSIYHIAQAGMNGLDYLAKLVKAEIKEAREGTKDSIEAKARRRRYKSVLRWVLVLVAMGAAHQIVSLLRKYANLRSSVPTPLLKATAEQSLPILTSPTASGGISGP